ncbi:1-aminocyclopropane-1-carboxylate deaminase/D-cysteine desulfhydrase [Chitinophaga sp. Cy-1792]|uniref:1-aminocyclopropane-1-carboxylate deaminase/D-cysteine desulfhydrase n=1 Tax=Chitinophaga sp. Cy-1792 TaxID=2608339 RepID=UPI001422E597|nr:pyridoxal-phosphate dependent enzyme [Chitinophaga sp. Cy-1792]NIG57256.1 pyridoxal-phosphate dependent enzyme [Chitinophaga sp. Cy-1792]
MPDYSKITIEPVQPSWLPSSVHLDILRLDKLHMEISGNKWFKLKYNLLAAKEAGQQTIITFGGAFSNHIAATAAACRDAGLTAVGIIRGEEISADTNATMAMAAANGMELRFISRSTYRDMQQPGHPLHQQLLQEGYVIPEGGHNAAGAKGCEEILQLCPASSYTHIICACGTGTTVAGIINAATAGQHVIAVSVLKGASYLETEIRSLLRQAPAATWELDTTHHGGGYGKINEDLITFMNKFFLETGIPTDVIYTGKTLMACAELLNQQYFPDNSRILMIHTGGLQGNRSQPPGRLSF